MIARVERGGRVRPFGSGAAKPSPVRRRARRGAIAFVARRAAAALPVLIGVTLLTFIVVDVTPGGAARQLLGPEATEAQVAQLEHELGLDRPAWQRYAAWLGGAVRGDLGESLASGQSVARLLGERLPVTLQLVAYGFAAALGGAVLAALFAARRPEGWADRLTMVMSLASLAAPSYLIAIALVLVFAVGWPLLPSIGYTPLGESAAGHLRSMTLPALAIALPMFGLYCRFLRGDLVEQMQSEGYVLTALAKGLTPWRVLAGHALRNSLLGLLTLVGVNAGNLIGGTVIVEQIFTLPGLGQLLLQSVHARDVPVILAVVLVLAVATVVANLVVDLLYAVLDPRIRHGRG